MNGMGTKWLAGTVLGLPLSIALCTLAINQNSSWKVPLAPAAVLSLESVFLAARRTT